MTACGSPCYAAPEMIAGKSYHGLNVDLWSCGIILYAMICGYLPFEDPNTAILYKKILNGAFNIPPFVSLEATDLIRSILRTDPNKRIKLEDVKKHVWLTKAETIPYNIGIIPDVDEIVIESDVLNGLTTFGFDLVKAEHLIKKNKHNNITATYYLQIRKIEMSKFKENSENLVDMTKTSSNINQDLFMETRAVKLKQEAERRKILNIKKLAESFDEDFPRPLLKKDPIPKTQNDKNNNKGVTSGQEIQETQITPVQRKSDIPNTSKFSRGTGQQFPTQGNERERKKIETSIGYMPVKKSNVKVNLKLKKMSEDSFSFDKSQFLAENLLYSTLYNKKNFSKDHDLNLKDNSSKVKLEKKQRPESSNNITSDLNLIPKSLSSSKNIPKRNQNLSNMKNPSENQASYDKSVLIEKVNSKLKKLLIIVKLIIHPKKQVQKERGKINHLLKIHNKVIKNRKIIKGK